MNWKQHLAAITLTVVFLVATPTPGTTTAGLAGAVLGKAAGAYLIVYVVAGRGSSETDETAETA